MLFSFDEDMRNGWIFFDEANYMIDSRRSGSAKNILFADIAQQVRKRGLSLVFTVQFVEWLERRVRQMLDLHIGCQDLSKSAWGWDENVPRGTEFLLDVQDWSGALTGQSYWKGGESTEWMLYGKPGWDIYDSFQLIDVWASRQTVKVEQDELKVRIGQNEELTSLTERYGPIEDHVRAIMTQYERIFATDLWTTLGVKTKEDKSQIRLIMANMGIRRVTSAGKELFALEEGSGSDS